MTEKYYILNEVAKAVGRKPYQIAYMLSNGELDEPKLWIGSRRIFTHEEIIRIKEIIDTKDQAGKRTASGSKKGNRQ